MPVFRRFTGSATYSGPAAGMFVMKTVHRPRQHGSGADRVPASSRPTPLWTAKFGDDTLTADDWSPWVRHGAPNFVLTNYDMSGTVGTLSGRLW